jgi:TnpA family transposase
MPRIPKLNKKSAKMLVSFQKPDYYKGKVIKPAAKVNVQNIIREWDNVKRILASLGMKETTQTSMVRKLASYDRQNPTFKALIEFDKIIMSRYILNYIDDPMIRKNVQRSLNRGESYHQLKSAIIKVSGRKIPGRTEMELNINNECAALLANCIVYYNASILSRLLERYEKEGNAKKVALLKRLSPVAWQHINMIGRYEFCWNRDAIDIITITDRLINELRNNEYYMASI